MVLDEKKPSLRGLITSCHDESVSFSTFTLCAHGGGGVYGWIPVTVIPQTTMYKC